MTVILHHGTIYDPCYLTSTYSILTQIILVFLFIGTSLPTIICFSTWDILPLRNLITIRDHVTLSILGLQR